MQNSWKQRLAAGAVSAAILGAVNFLLATYRYNRPREIALARQAHAFSYYSGGKHVGGLLIADILAAILYVAILIVPYELTLRALLNKRLSGED